MVKLAFEKPEIVWENGKLLIKDTTEDLGGLLAELTRILDVCGIEEQGD